MSNFAFIRIPKTGTTSLIQTLRPYINTPENPCLSLKHEVIDTFLTHDHPHEFLTIVRDPLQVYCSAYYFLKNHIHAAEARGVSWQEWLPNNALGNHMEAVNASATLNDYIDTAPDNDFFGKYLGSHDISTFAYVGDVNHMQDSVSLLGGVTGFTPKYAWMNKNPKRPDDLRPYLVDTAVTSRFISRNSVEYDVYSKGLERFVTLKGMY